MKNVPNPDPPAPESARLTALIREQAAAEAAAVLAQAQERAQRQRAAAAAQAGAIHDAAQRNGEERGRRRAAEILAVTDAESRREWLRAREKLLDTAMEQAWIELARFAQMPQAITVLSELIAEALAVLPPGPVRVQLPEAYDQIFEQAKRTGAIPDGRVVRVERASVPDGVIAETEDGRLRFDNSFEARARRRKETLRRLVADALFSDAAPAQEPS